MVTRLVGSGAQSEKRLESRTAGGRDKAPAAVRLENVEPINGAFETGAFDEATSTHTF